uniref:NADH dehydrogenase subunit 6 n=1 Tax=Xestocephalus limpidissimus TaxID=3112140 RepID=UPI002E768DC5|nr:NADH dehydrogenase subunit 6 [Xestocephalus limpidissimus]WRK21333.1 NADH dehydrogenase subunit 6 [Xestocephalus limpidissimus]
MKMMMMKLIMIMSSALPTIKSPMPMGMLLITQTLIMTMLMNKICSTSWFTLMTFLMMIGGMMIIIMYMTSITSNEKFKMNIMISMLIIILVTMSDELMIELQINENQEMINLINTEKLSMIKMYNNKSMLLTLMMILYLLLTMISISKIIKHNKGPLRSKYYE